MTEFVGLAASTWALLAVGAVCVGFAKTAVGGTATVAVALFATVLPARESTGVLLVLLMLGDLIGIFTYRRHAQLHLLAGLVLPVLVGVAVGIAFLAAAPGEWLRPVIGAIVVAMSLIEIGRRVSALRARRLGPVNPAAVGGSAQRSGRGSGRVFGVLAGFTTMVANAGGPVMTVYLLRSGAGVQGFLGTIAWFFWLVNVVKLPFSIGLGLLRPERAGLILSLVPLVLVGAVVGRVLIARVSKTVFEWTVLVVAGLSGAYLLLS